MKLFSDTVSKQWLTARRLRQRLISERCAACGAGPGELCMVAYGKGPDNAKPDLTLTWGHAQPL